MSADTPSGFPWSGMLRAWIFGDEGDEGDEVPAPEAASDDLDPAILIATLQADLRARDAEIEALRLQVARPGYDPALSDVVGQRRPGRPRVMTPERKEALLKQLFAGMFRIHACEIVGIGMGALQHAMRADPLFKHDVQRAELMGTASAAVCFRRAAGRDWRAAQEYLARKHPAEWGRQQQAAYLAIDDVATTAGKAARAAMIASLIGDDVTPSEPMHAGDEDEGDE